MNTLTELLQIVGNQLNKKPEAISLNADLYEDLGADDLDRVENALEIERGFGVTISDDAEFGARTVEDLWCLANGKPLPPREA